MTTDGNHTYSALRLFVLLLCVATLVHVALLFPRFLDVAAGVPPEARPLLFGLLVTLATAVGACLLALVLVTRSWARPGARSLALFLAFLSVVWGSILRFLEVEVGESELSVGLEVGGLNAFLAGLGLVLAVAAFVRFSTVFPVVLRGDALPPTGRLRALRRVRVALFRPWLVWTVAVAVALLPQAAGRVIGWWMDPAAAGDGGVLEGVNLAVAGVVHLLVPLAGIALGMRNLVSGYRLAPPPLRRRTLWLVAGASAAGWMVLVPLAGLPSLLALGVELPDLAFLVGAALLVVAPAVLVASAVAALFYAGAVDPSLVLRRSTVVGALGAGAILLFAGLENVLSEWVADRLGLPGFVGSMLAGSVAAGVVIPMRKGLGRLVGRLLPTGSAVPGEGEGGA